MTDSPAFVRHVSLLDMRNYAELEVELGPGTHVLVGANGQGKTNLVESIVYLSTLSSHRVASDAPLIRHGAERAVIRADVTRDDRSLLIEVEVTAGKANRARINRNAVPRTREILGIVRTVVFAPEDLALVKGDPSDRRRFLDDLMVQRQPRLAGVRADYDRVLRQRNTLLKSAGAARRRSATEVDATLAAWDDQLARYGAEITLARRDLITALSPLATRAYAELIPGGDTITLHYRSAVEERIDGDVRSIYDELLRLLGERRKDELDRGITLVGPHRDEMEITLGPAPLKGYASHGESWSAALALRLASYDLLTAEAASPVLILDDVFAELDSSRRQHLVERIRTAPQVIITAAVADDVPQGLAAQWYDVVAGQVTARD